MDAASALKADATQNGDGGTVVVWSDQRTDFAGHISATGGEQGGDGGNAEVSGKAVLGFTGKVDLTAANGGTGTLLLDPYNVRITDVLDSDWQYDSQSGTYAPITQDSKILAEHIVANLASADILVTTGSAGSQAGDISVEVPLAWSGVHTLTLQAAHDIRIDAAISAPGGGLTLDAGNAISASAALDVGIFTLVGGDWRQLGSTLPSFSATGFRLAGGSFLRAQGGGGGSGDPWRLVDVYGVQGMGTLLSGHFQLAGDIDASGTAGWALGFRPIGASSGTSGFVGSLDGQGHTIDGLTVRQTGEGGYAGLFGVLYGSVRDLGLTRVDIRNLGGNRTGGLAGWLVNEYGTASVSGVYVTGKVSGLDMVGGLLGETDQAPIELSHADVEVSGTDAVGGLLGLARATTISNVHASGSVTGTGSAVGGLIGQNGITDGGSLVQGASVSHAYATGSVQGGQYVGGLVGYNSGVIDNAWASAQVVGATAGGVVGYSDAGTLRNVYWDTDSSGQAAWGGGSLIQTNLAPVYAYAGNRYAHASYAHLGSWSETASGSGIWVADAASGNSTWVMIEGATRPFLYSEWSTSIGNAHQLQLMVLDPSADYLLAGDIDAGETAGGDTAGMWSAAGFVPVGDNWTGDDSLHFSGSLDGQGHVIDGLSIDRADRPFNGLFGYIAEGGRVSDLGLVNARVAASGGSGYASGALAGESHGRLAGVWVEDSTVAGDSNAIGGLVGYNWGSLERARAANVQVSGSSSVGGLAGQNGGIIDQAWSSGTVSGDSGVGGLVGISVDSGEIGNAWSSAAVSADTSTAGGLVGQNLGRLDTVYARGAVGISGASGFAAGGLVGENRGSIANAYATGAVIAAGSAMVGGLVGSNNGGGIQDAYATGAVTGYEAVGGLVGGNMNREETDGWGNVSVTTASLANSYATGLVRASGGYGGGLAGLNLGSIRASFWNAETSGQALGIGYSEGAIAGEASGLTSQGLLDLATFAAAGWSIDDVGGGSGAWRIYDGHTTPLLRNFLTLLTVDAEDLGKTYDGLAGGALADYATSLGDALDASQLQGSLEYLAASKNVGSYSTADGGLTLSGLYSGQQGYDIGYAEASLTISPRAVTVSLDDLAKVYGEADPTLAWRITSGSLADGDQLSATLARDSGETVGNYAIDATLTGALASGNYAVTLENGALTISPRAVTVSLDDLAKVYGEADPTLAWRITSGSLADGDQLSATLARDSGETVGNYAIDATLTGALASGNYSVTLENGVLSITPRAITVALDDLSKVYGEADPALGWRVSGGSLAFDDQLSGELSRAAGENAGNYAIGATLAGDLASGNYAVTVENGVLSITPRAITVALDDLSKVYGEADPALGWRVSGGSLAFDDQLSGELSRATGENVGDYGIGATLTGALASGNYAVTLENGVLSIVPRAITVSADDLGKVAGQADPMLTWTLGGLGLAAWDRAAEVFSGDLARDSGEAEGDYAIRLGDLAANANYALAFAGGTLAIESASPEVPTLPETPEPPVPPVTPEIPTVPETPEPPTSPGTPEVPTPPDATEPQPPQATPTAPDTLAAQRPAGLLDAIASAQHTGTADPDDEIGDEETADLFTVVAGGLRLPEGL